MEDYAYKGAKTKDEYLGFADRLIMHLRDLGEYKIESK